MTSTRYPCPCVASKTVQCTRHAYRVGTVVQIGEEQATVIDYYNDRYPVLSYADGTEQTVEQEAISGLA